MPPSGHRLVVYPEDANPQLVRDALTVELGLHPTDAMRLAAHVPGVIPVPLSEPSARSLVLMLEHAGIDAEAWRADELPDLSEPRDVHRVQLTPQGLEAIGPRGEPAHWLPWPQVELVSVGLVRQGPKQRVVTTPSWIRVAAAVVRPRTLLEPSRRAGKVKTARAPLAELWLVRDRPIQALRCRQDCMSYDYLADRLQTSSTANFRLLVEDLLRYSANASRTPATESFLVFDRPGRHFFASAQDLMEYTTWQMLLRWRARSA